ncbi:glycoside hydrolase family 3 N-terminal domain-containing protein [Streptosporangium lutulentum]
MPHRSPDLARLALTVLQPGFEGTVPPRWLLRELADGLGGTVLFARNLTGAAQTAELVARLREENPAVVVAVDEEGGSVTRLQAATGSSWPGNRALGVVDDVERTKRVAGEIGRLLAAADITLDYAPVADVNANPANPVIGIRSFGPDPGLVSRQTTAWITGLQDAGVAACAKHFPGHGDTVTDSHHALPTVHASLRLLRERDLPPFAAAVKAGVRAVMCGHLLVPALDPDHPATLSRKIMTGLLREELGFDGMLVTDAIEMGAVAALHPPGEIAVRALAAGVDAICAASPPPTGRPSGNCATRSWRPYTTEGFPRIGWPRRRRGCSPWPAGTPRTPPSGKLGKRRTPAEKARTARRTGTSAWRSPARPCAWSPPTVTRPASHGRPWSWTSPRG